MKGNGWVGGLICYIISNGGHNATKMLRGGKKTQKCDVRMSSATEDGVDAEGK